MEIEQVQWTEQSGWGPAAPGRLAGAAQIVFVFACPSVLRNADLLGTLRSAWPRAHMFGCSTAGEICGTRVEDHTMVATAVRFRSTRIAGAAETIEHPSKSFDVGARLGRALPRDGLVHAIVLSDGVHVNGSDLVKGLVSEMPAEVTVTGGLSADGGRFQETFVLWDGPPRPDTVAIVGFYGPDLRVGYGSLGGWDPFGPERLITRSEGNVLYEVDGRSALDLYKEYLGEHARDLPGAGLLFPLSIRSASIATPVVRTILSVDEERRSITFAGDVPQGAYARLMKANFNRLIDGAAGAAKTCYEAVGRSAPDFALLISCVGRKMVLKQRVEEEVEGVRDVLGERTVLTGFYSNGEISPFTPNARCELHNQTMTITTLSER